MSRFQPRSKASHGSTRLMPAWPGIMALHDHAAPPVAASRSHTDRASTGVRAAGPPRPCARSSRGRGARTLSHADHPQRHGDRRHRRAAGGSHERRHRGEPDRADQQRRDAGRSASSRSAGAVGRSPRRDRDVPDARLRQPARTSRRYAKGAGGGVRLQAVHGARRDDDSRGAARGAGRSRSRRRSAAPPTRSSRRASTTISAPARDGARGRSIHRRRRAPGCAGARPTAWTA